MSAKLKKQLAQLLEDRNDYENEKNLSKEAKKELLRDVDAEIAEIRKQIADQPKSAKKAAPATKKVVEKKPEKPIEVPKEEEKPTPKETAPIRTPKEVPTGKDPLAHCKDVLSDFRQTQKVLKIKNQLIEEAQGDEKKLAEITAMTKAQVLAVAPEKPTLSVPEATKAKLATAIAFNARQQQAKQKLTQEQKEKINDKVADLTKKFYYDVETAISEIIKEIKNA